MDTLRGIVASDWWRLLRQERFAVDRGYRDRALAATRISLENAVMKRREDRRFAHLVANAEIRAPVFILGHWRSGTTLLHELLALDDQFAYPNAFQVSNPHTFLSREDEVARILEGEAGQSRPMDNMVVTFRSPAEDEVAMAVTSLCSPLIAWAFPRREAHYDRYYTFRDTPPEDAAAWKASFLWFLRKLSWKYQRPLVLKSPAHTGRVRMLLDLFPTAKFIHIHRDPYAVFRSTQQLYARAVPHSHLQRPSSDSADAGILRRYEQIYQAFFEDRALIPAGQYCDVRFETLEQDVVGQVASIYAHLCLPGFERLRPRLEEYVRGKADYRKNRHEPLPEPTRAAIASAWGSSFAEWGYPE